MFFRCYHNIYFIAIKTRSLNESTSKFCRKCLKSRKFVLKKRNQVGTKCLHAPVYLQCKKKERRNYKSAQDTLLGKMVFFGTLMYMKKNINTSKISVVSNKKLSVYRSSCWPKVAAYLVAFFYFFSLHLHPNWNKAIDLILLSLYNCTWLLHVQRARCNLKHALMVREKDIQCAQKTNQTKHSSKTHTQTNNIHVLDIIFKIANWLDNSSYLSASSRIK